MVGRPRAADRATDRAITGSLSTAVLFTLAAVATTQLHWLRAGSPWQDDPYDAVVSFTMFVVPAVAAFLVVRMLLGWLGLVDRREPFRVAQLLRACCLMLVLIAVTLVADVVAVLLGADRDLWNGRTPALLVGLAVLIALTGSVASLVLAAVRRTGWTEAARGTDWLSDLQASVPGLVTEPRAAWVRRHLFGCALGLSCLAAVGTSGALAIGEGWSDPLLVGWAFTVDSSGYLAFCLVANPLLRLVDRPARVGVGEIAAVTAGLGIQVSVALRDPIAEVLSGHTVGSVGVLVALTGAAAVFGAVAGVLLNRVYRSFVV